MYRLAQIRIGITPLASRQRYHGTCVPCVSIVGVNFQTAVEPVVGFGSILLRQIYLRLERIGWCKLLPLHDDGVEIELCTTVVLVFDTTQCTVVPCALVLRIEAYGCIVVGYGLRIVLLTYTAQSTQLIHIIYIWIEPYGSRHVGFGTTEIVEIELGKASKKPRLVEIWLCREHLIEILYRQHVVFIVQRTASRHHKAVGIILG